MNNEMNDLSVKNGLPHWKCVSKKHNKWWRRDDGMEYTIVFLSEGSIFDSLRKLDRRFPIGSNVVELKDSMPDNSQSHTKKLLLDMLERIEDEEKREITNNGSGDFEFDKQLYNAIMNGIYQKPTKKQPALVQKPFQYPCDGALYFTSAFYNGRRNQVFFANTFTHSGKHIASITRNGHNGYCNSKTGKCMVKGNGGFIEVESYSYNDVIMFVWE